MAFLFTILAQAYGAGNYNSGVYNGSTSSGSGGTLADTGFIVAVVITAAAVLLLIALLVRFWRRPSKNKDDEK